METYDFNTALWLLIIGAFGELLAFVAMVTHDQHGPSQFCLIIAAAAIVSIFAGIAALVHDDGRDGKLDREREAWFSRTNETKNGRQRPYP